MIVNKIILEENNGVAVGKSRLKKTPFPKSSETN
jgi:hypothetical protein